MSLDQLNADISGLLGGQLPERIFRGTDDFAGVEYPDDQLGGYQALAGQFDAGGFDRVVG